MTTKSLSLYFTEQTQNVDTTSSIPKDPIPPFKFDLESEIYIAGLDDGTISNVGLAITERIEKIENDFLIDQRLIYLSALHLEVETYKLLYKALIDDVNSFSVIAKAKAKVTRPLKELLAEAEELSCNGYLYNSSRGILKTGIKRAIGEGNYSDLLEYVPKMRIKALKYEKEIKARDQREGEAYQKRVIATIKSNSKAQLLKRMAKCKQISEKGRIYWTEERGKAERTARKAHISNKLDSNAYDMLLLQEALKQFDTIR